MIERLIQNILLQEIRENPPISLEDCCRVAARALVSVKGDLSQCPYITSAAWAMASTVFGEGFTKASEHQRMIWLDLCEDQILVASKEVAI